MSEMNALSTRLYEGTEIDWFTRRIPKLVYSRAIAATNREALPLKVSTGHRSHGLPLYLVKIVCSNFPATVMPHRSEIKILIDNNRFSWLFSRHISSQD